MSPIVHVAMPRPVRLARPSRARAAQTLNLAFLPPAVAGIIQDGILDRNMREALKPALLWRSLFEKKRHPGQVGERVTMTRDALIAPGTPAQSRRTAGSDPTLVTRAKEQFGYQIVPYGKGLDIHLPSIFLASAKKFEDDTNALGFHAAQVIGRTARDALFAAYGGGNSFAPNAGSSVTALVVSDATGFDTAMVNGLPLPLSVSNPLAITIGSTSANVTACDLTTNTLTLAASTTWAQYDAVLRVDAPYIVRQGGRATDHAIVGADIATMTSFRAAAAYLRGHNVPGINGLPGGDYACYIDSDTENQLFADTEFRQAIAAVGNTGVYAEGTLGRYAGILFMRMPKSESGLIPLATTGYQTTVHRSVMVGADVGIEAYIPETDFQRVVVPEGIASANHYKMPLDPEAVLTMVIRGPLDRAGEIVSASWLANVDYTMPSDALAATGAQRHKRACLIHTAGPA